MSTSILGLPPAPAELKPVIPYIQRAEELKNQDRVVSYWCAYYAAQLGISLKARDPNSREFLFALLGALEQMKSELGANDAIDIESVSSAYVENFALRVFANADNEDRNGRSTRSTAKKFLAAANFLEILKTFPKKDISESNEDKIRYAKWKAADIAKAFREGRKPLPGPPGWAEEQEELRLLLQQERQAQKISSVPTNMPNVPSNLSLTSPSDLTGTSPPSSSHIPSSFPSKHSPPSSSPPKFSNTRNDINDMPSDNWSNAATPGTGVPDHIPPNAYFIGTPTPSTAGYDWRQESAVSGPAGLKIVQDASNRTRSGSESSSRSRDAKSSSPTKSSFKSASPDSDKRVHFSPSAAGSPPPSPSKQTRSSPPREYTGPADIYAPPPHHIPPPTVIYPIQPPAPPPSVPFSSSPPRSYIYGPPASSVTSPPHVPMQYAPPPPPPSRREVELTPELIAKVQKRCRFAISSLDYEDAEQAKKELRAALALLGE